MVRTKFSVNKSYKALAIFLVQGILLVMTPMSSLAQSKKISTFFNPCTQGFYSTGTTVKSPNGRPWTVIGGSGLVNQADLDKYDVTDVSSGDQVAGIRVKSNKPQASVHVRYNITAVDDALQGSSGNQTVRHFWVIRYRDNSAFNHNASNGPAHVHLDLFRTEQNGPNTTLVQSFDSRDPCVPNNANHLSVVNNQTVVLFWDDPQFNFDTFTYWISATLDKNNASGDPRLSNMKLLDCGSGSGGGSCSVVGTIVGS